MKIQYTKIIPILVLIIFGYSCSKEIDLGIEGNYNGIEICGGNSNEISIELTKSAFPNNLDFISEELPEFRGMWSGNNDDIVLTDLTLIMNNSPNPMRLEGEFQITGKVMEGNLEKLNGEVCTYVLERE